MHERAHDTSINEKRGDVLIVRGMQVFSRILGVSGACDVVEFRASKTGVSLHGRQGNYQVVPIEYKHGKPLELESDSMQLCAQAMCIEEMFLCDVPCGYLFYGEPRRRTEVVLNSDLRQKVTEMFAQMHEYAAREYTPKVKPRKGCNSCSLKDLCLPRLDKSSLVRDYVSSKLNAENGTCESF